MKKARRKAGADLIAAERREQQRKHHWSATHDDEHDASQLAIEAAGLAVMGTRHVLYKETGSHTHPLRAAGDEWGLQNKLFGHRIHQLKVAGALIAAEIDRLLRCGVKDE